MHAVGSAGTLLQPGDCIGTTEQEIQTALAMARLTALRKPDGGVRGIAVHRRRVSPPRLPHTRQACNGQRCLTKQPAARTSLHYKRERARMHSQLTCESHLPSAGDAVLVSLDGRSAYDSMSRAAFLSKLREVAPELLPFTRMFYGRPSVYSWWDGAGRHREVRQGEGCEQGDPLAPALYALGQHDALQRATSGRHLDGFPARTTCTSSRPQAARARGAGCCHPSRG